MIRKATADDINETAEIFRELHEHHIQLRPDFYRSPDAEFYRNQLAEHLDYVFVIENDGVIQGYATVYIDVRDDCIHVARKRCFVDQFAVKKEFRRKGIGSKLMQFIREYALENDCTVIELGVWYENYDAVDFYGKNGFVPRTLNLELILKKE